MRARWRMVLVATLMPVLGSDALADERVDAFATRTLQALQADALARRTESCGYIYRLDGELHARTQRGNRELCDSDPDRIPDGAELVASFHNHGAFSEDFDSEVPSLDDMDVDREDRINGYVATPGGRLWKILWRERAAVLLCGGCIARDPRHRDEVFLPVKPRYTRAELEARVRADSR